MDEFDLIEKIDGKLVDWNNKADRHYFVSFHLIMS